MQIGPPLGKRARGPGSSPRRVSGTFSSLEPTDARIKARAASIFQSVTTFQMLPRKMRDLSPTSHREEHTYQQVAVLPKLQSSEVPKGGGVGGAPDLGGASRDFLPTDGREAPFAAQELQSAL